MKTEPIKRVLIIVDVQNDFCPGGALAVPNGDEIIPPINALTRECELYQWPVVASRDWHPEKTAHFKPEGPWPVHCVQNTHGAKFHKGLELPKSAIIISKGQDTRDDGYSAAQGVTEDGKTLEEILRREKPQGVLVVGLATDYCVKATALDIRKMGYVVRVFSDACRAVNINPDDERKAYAEMIKAGVRICEAWPI